MSEWPHGPAADVDDDPSIPLLTDRIYLPAVDLDTALPTSASPEPAARETAVVADASTPASVEPEVVETAEAGTEAVDGEQQAAESDASIEVELDHDLVAASNADFDALLSAEPQVVGIETLPASMPIESTAAIEEAAIEEAAVEEAEVEETAVERPALEGAEVVPPAAATDVADLGARAEALRTAVLQRVAARLPEQVNAALHDLMQPAIDQAMAKLGEEAEIALRIALQELVEQVLRDELGHHKGSGPRE